MKILFIIFPLMIVPVMILLAAHVVAQTPQGSDVLNLLESSNASSTTDIVSYVENVTVTKIDVKSPTSIGVDLRYHGPGKAPSVKVESSVIDINSDIIEDVMNQIDALNQSSTDLNASIFTTSIDEKLGQLGTVVAISNATKEVDAGWKSPKTITLKLKGNTTLNDAEFITLVVRK